MRSDLPDLIVNHIELFGFTDIPELAREFKAAPTTIRRHLLRLRRTRRIYVKSYQRTLKGGYHLPVYAVGNKPDAPYLEPIPKKILAVDWYHRNRARILMGRKARKDQLNPFTQLINWANSSKQK